MTYAALRARLDKGGTVILDGGTGSELQRRGVPMSPDAWCGPATITHAATLESIHVDYIRAGADIITANTYASSRLMLEPAGLGDRVAEVNRIAVETALEARGKAGVRDVVVAGSLSHMVPIIAGTADFEPATVPDAARLSDAFNELATILSEAGCDLILLEMMYLPDRMTHALKAARSTSLPVWAGLSARRADDGAVVGFSPYDDIPFADLARLAAEAAVEVAGVMHNPSNIVADAIAIVRQEFDGPYMAYPDSGYFMMPDWQFVDIIPPAEFAAYASRWVADGVQVIGGCCGLSPAHISAIADLKAFAA